MPLFIESGENMIMQLSDAKEFLRIETSFSDEDSLITSLLLAGESYMENATGKKFSGTNELAKLCLKMLIAHWYENRGVVTFNNANSKLPYGVDCLLSQLSLLDGDVV